MIEKNVQPKLYHTLRMSLESDIHKTVNEIVLKSEYTDGISFNDIMNTFRQFLLAIGYSEETAKGIRCLTDGDLEELSLSIKDLHIVEMEI